MIEIAERVKKLKPWPIMGYNTPKKMKGDVITKLCEFSFWRFIVAIRWKRWGETEVSEDKF